MNDAGVRARHSSGEDKGTSREVLALGTILSKRNRPQGLGDYELG